MADIEINCANCGTTITVSEFADLALLVCRSCGENVQKAPEPGPPPAADEGTSQHHGLRDAVEQDGAPPPAARRSASAGPPLIVKGGKSDPAANRPESDGGKASDSAAARPRAFRPAVRKRRRFQIRHDIGAWLLFIVLGAGMAYLRYGEVLSLDDLSIMTSYAPLVVIALHVVIVLKSFKDSVFQGILCMIVPLYSFYYLIFVSDDFFMRAAFVGLLAGFGQDGVVYYYEHAASTLAKVSAWIASGGGG